MYLSIILQLSWEINEQGSLDNNRRMEQKNRVDLKPC